MLILGLDPGGTTGWALLELERKKFSLQDWGHDKDTSMAGQEENIRKADLVIVEDFLVDPKHARRGAFDRDRMIAPQVIGSIKTLCRVLDTPYHLQPNSVKPVGYGYINKKYVKGKQGMHKWDALAHAAYYAVTRLGAFPAGVNVNAPRQNIRPKLRASPSDPLLPPDIFL